jgi:hypothetical protein
MRSSVDGALRLTTGYHETRGRAAEIARGQGSWISLAEHFFVGMLHDGGPRCMKVLSRSVDLSEAESAVLAIMDGPGHAVPPAPGRPVPMIQHGIWGVQAAVRMGHTVISVDHAFLDMIRQRDTVPARALVSLGLDLDAVDDTVVEAMTAPTPVPDGVPARRPGIRRCPAKSPPGRGAPWRRALHLPARRPAVAQGERAIRHR